MVKKTFYALKEAWMQVNVELISWTKDPIETIYLLWEASRKKEAIPTIEELKLVLHTDPELADRVFETFQKVLTSAIPVSENINFIFLLENVSISFREQMVRHRVGVKVGERIGMDYFPDVHDSTWWSQSMRVLDMGDFAEKTAYNIPDSIRVNEEALNVLQTQMHCAAQAYRELIKLGIAAEDAREVIPLATQHRISWSLNLATFAHILSKRSCWILQLGLWEPVLMGMLEELCEKVNPIFSILATPPCMKGDFFKRCCFDFDNEKRCKGEDPLPPCSLYLSHTDVQPENLKEIEDRKDFQKMCLKYKKFWRRDVSTGKLF